MTPEEINALMPLIASKFIQRRDPVAIQTRDGGYRPLRDSETKVPTAIFNKTTLQEHLSGEKTYGHYMLDRNSMTKLFVLDIDLTQAGFVPMKHLNRTDPSDKNYQEWVRSFYCVPNLRDIWHSRRPENKPAREYIKYQFRLIGNMLAASTHTLLDIHTAVAYTGNKGIHVYGFTGPLPGSDARDAAELVLDSAGVFKPSRGDNFFADSRREIIPFTHDGPDPEYLRRWMSEGPLDTFEPEHFHNFHVEIFPKQRSLEGKDLGNLVRLPLGRNLHAPSDPTFFLDLSAAFTEFKPVDPVYALTCTDPWMTQAEASIAV